jgi:flagellar motor switch protein FliN/FliY
MPDPTTENAPEDAILRAVQVEVTVRIGKAQPTMFELSQLGPDMVLPLDTAIDDPVDLYVGSNLIAAGELEEVDGPDGAGIAVRITRVFDQTKSGK